MNIYLYTYFPSYYTYLSYKKFGLEGYFYIYTDPMMLKINLLKVSKGEKIEDSEIVLKKLFKDAIEKK
ncbi:MAG: hypothetical protein PUK80_06190 [Firmicutes bacterium]|nr:hypothetical protein [Bacillota bacterium]